MAAIGLEIVLNKSDKLYMGGEKITGQVKVHVNEEFRCHGLVLGLYCYGIWNDNFERGVKKETEASILFEGSWAPGDYSYRFEMPTPHSPLTYKGQIFDVAWDLRAEARPFAGENVTASAGITIVSEKKMSEEVGRKSSEEIVHTETASSQKMLFTISVAVILSGLIIAWISFLHNNDTGFLFGGVIPAILGFIMLFFVTRRILVNMRIGRVEVRINSRVVRPGERIPCSVTFQTTKSYEVERVSVILRGEEFVDFTSSSNKGKLGYHLVYENQQELPLAVKQVPANVPILAQGEVLVPADIPYTINLIESRKSVELRWQLEFIVEMKKWPAWKHHETITVQP